MDHQLDYSIIEIMIVEDFLMVFLAVEVEPVGFDCFFETPDFTMTDLKKGLKNLQKCFNKMRKKMIANLGSESGKLSWKEIRVFIPLNLKMKSKREIF